MDILDITNYWFDPTNSNKWFNASKEDDVEIIQKFKKYLSLELDIEDIMSDLTNLKPIQYLGHVILYDQLVRHFYREIKDSDTIDYYGQKALSLAMNILNHNFDKDFNPEQRCFLLLPLRHTFKLDYLEIVIHKIKEYMIDYDASIYKRFWKATIISYYSLKVETIDTEPIDDSIDNEDIFNN